MKQEIQMLEQLLEKYRLTEPVPEEVRAYFLKRKKKFFVKVCKSLGIYNIFFGSVITVFFIMKKLGLAVTVIQSAIIVTMLTVISFASVTWCGYTFILPLIHNEMRHEKIIPSPIEPKEEIVVIPPLLSLKAPPLIIVPGAITESGTGINISLFKDEFLFHLKEYYPRVQLHKSARIKNYVNLHAVLIRVRNGYDFYIRLSDTKGICFNSLQYHAENLQTLYTQTKYMARDLAEVCAQ